jgi:sn-glycerol 3-phosphate transport system permease protein
LEKRATFSNLWLAAAFIAPQMLLIFVFFYWPSGEALYWAVTLEPPFGGSNDWVGLLNFQTVFADPKYWSSVRISLAFAGIATALSLVIAVILALFVDRRLPGHQVYKFTFFLPYALAAPAVALPSASSSRRMRASSRPSTGSFPTSGIPR